MPVSRDERMATNPLTDEQVVVRDFISDLAGSSRLDVLHALDGQSMTPSAIENRGQVSRQTASNHLTELTEQGLTKLAGSEGGYELTAGGKIVLDAFETCLKEIDLEQLTHLTRSTHSIQLLQTLSEDTVRPSELTGTGSESPSRATVQRVVRMFEEQGWSEDVTEGYRLTPAGERVLEAYEELTVTMEQVIEKAPWLQRLGPGRADVPIQALADAKLLISGPDSPGIVLAAALRLCDPRLDHYRVLFSIFNPTLFRAYNQLLKLGLKGEAIVDSSLYTRLHEEGMEYFLNDSEFDNFRILRLDEPLTLGVALYDTQKVAVGAYNETGEGEHIAMILSSHDALVEWGTDLYNSYREQARHATENSSETAG